MRECAEPRPGEGQILISVSRCGICGSDLHARRHCDHMGALATRAGLNGLMRASENVVMGHEICGEVLETGPTTDRKLRPGTPVVALPILRGAGGGIEMLGFSARANGGYAERMLVEASLTLPVPNGLSADMAAMTEPMAVGWHAVRRGDVRKRDVAIVIGCGPVGLAVICALKAKGVSHILAADFSPERRALALACGADTIIDPAATSPFANWQSFGFIGTVEGLVQTALQTRAALGKLPIPWWHGWRIAQWLGAAPKRPVIFECVGVPGVLQSIIDEAPLTSRIVVVGVCMESDRIEPSMAINKEIEMRFALGYSPLEFRDTLHMIASGKLQPATMLTGTVGLAGIETAFDILGRAGAHCKILVNPASTALAPQEP